MIDTRKSKLLGCTTVLAYYGSSDFDNAQMSRLIDNCIEDCKSVGVKPFHRKRSRGSRRNGDET